MTTVTIDPNVRVRGNGTYAGFEDVDGPIYVGLPVTVVEDESCLVGNATVTEIDISTSLVYLTVDWSSLKVVDESEHAPADAARGFVFAWAGIRSLREVTQQASFVLATDNAQTVTSENRAKRPHVHHGTAQELILSAS